MDGEITRILQDWDADRAMAIEALTPLVYGELRKIADGYLRRQRPGHTLQPTALVHEAYMRLVKQDTANLKDRVHFFTLSARIMRQILVDAARSFRAEKRGSGNKVSFEAIPEIANEGAGMEILTLHEALDRLKTHSERTAQVIELKYFGGLQLEEIAEALEVSLATVKRDQAIGLAWLKRALSDPPAAEVAG